MVDPIRCASPSDLDFLVEADIRADEDEQATLDVDADAWDRHRDKLLPFVTEPSRGAWIHRDDGPANPRAGMLLARFRDPLHEPDIPENRFLLDRVLATLDPRWLPSDGRFTEVFQLWVHPQHRRRGIARRLKQHLEQVSRARGIGLLYTHTRADYTHVVALNEALGYTAVRHGPLWDELPRISLVKRLD